MRAHQLPPPQIAFDLLLPFDRCALERWRRYFEQLLASTDDGKATAPKTLHIQGFRGVSATTLPDPPPRPSDGPQVPTRYRTLYFPESHDANPGVELIVDCWSGEPRAAMSFMAELLAMAERPPARIEDASSVAFAAPDGASVWILYWGAAVRLMSSGPAPADLRTLLKHATPL
jgi:hypothetical protein